MERVRFIEHGDTRILLADYSGIRRTEDLRRAVEEGKAILRAEPAGSVLVLVVLRDVAYTLENVQVLREAVKANRRYVRARAVVGLPEIARLSYRAVAAISGRPMEAFEDAEDAKEWLAEQA